MKRISKNQLEQWLFLAERAMPAASVCTMFHTDWVERSRTLDQNEPEAVLVDQYGSPLAMGMSWEDGHFYFAARAAVIRLVYELLVQQKYSDYVSETVFLAEKLHSEQPAARLLPLSFDEWLKLEKKGERV